MMMAGNTGSPTTNHRSDDRPHYAITVRLLRLVSILVRKYHKLLVCINMMFITYKKIVNSMNFTMCSIL